MTSTPSLDWYVQRPVLSFKKVPRKHRAVLTLEGNVKVEVDWHDKEVPQEFVGKHISKIVMSNGGTVIHFIDAPGLAINANTYSIEDPRYPGVHFPQRNEFQQELPPDPAIANPPGPPEWATEGAESPSEGTEAEG